MKSSSKQRTIIVPDGIGQVRLDRFLAEHPELELSRSSVQQIIADRRVTVDGRTATKSLRLRGGETIALTIPPPEKITLAAEDIPIDIAFEDEYLAVINKPPGLVVHPAPGNPSHTLVNAILHHFGQVSEEADNPRPGIIHRLDKDTSGLILVAKSDSVAAKLRREMAARRIKKTYLAIICGHLSGDEGIINLPIGRSHKDRKKMAVTDVRSREAVTHYRLLRRYDLVDLVEIGLVTGRTHQIRVHFSHLHHPVLGDPVYGGRTKWVKGIDPSRRKSAQKLLELIDRQALHAGRLVFDHPVTGEMVSVTGGPPQDLKRLIKYLDAAI